MRLYDAARTRLNYIRGLTIPPLEARGLQLEAHGELGVYEKHGTPNSEPPNSRISLFCKDPNKIPRISGTPSWTFDEAHLHFGQGGHVKRKLNGKNAAGNR